MRNVLALSLMLLTGAPALAQSNAPFWVKPDPFDPRGYGLTFAVFAQTQAAIDHGPDRGLYAYSAEPSRPWHEREFVARWRGQGWEALTAGICFVESFSHIVVLDDGTGLAPYAAGRYFNPSTGFTYKGWRWKHDRWEETPPGFIQPYGPAFAMPYFSLDDGTGMAIYGWGSGGIAKWDGTAWQVLGGPLANVTSAAIVPADLGSGTRLVLVGDFTAIGSVPLPQGAVVWDGQRWSPLGQTFLVGDIRGLDVFDNGSGPHLYVGGLLTLDGVNVLLIRYDGHAWSAVPNAPAGIRNIKAFDDGSGIPGLFITGDFATAGGVPVARIVKFDGTHWYPLGAGSGYYSEGMQVYRDVRGPSLFVSMGGGNNSPVGGGIVGAGIAQWVGCPNCYANCDNSTAQPRLTANDFMCFLNRYAVRDPYANCTVNEVINIADFQCFLSKFAAGCP